MFKHRDRADCWSVLVVDDDPVVRHLTRENLRGVDVDGLPLEIDACENTDAARKLIAATEYALIIMDVAIETEFAGLDLVEELEALAGGWLHPSGGAVCDPDDRAEWPPGRHVRHCGLLAQR